MQPVGRRADQGTALPGYRAGRGKGPPGPPRRQPVHRGVAWQMAGRARRPSTAALPRHAVAKAGAGWHGPACPAPEIRRTIIDPRWRAGLSRGRDDMSNSDLASSGPPRLGGIERGNLTNVQL